MGSLNFNKGDMCMSDPGIISDLQRGFKLRDGWLKFRDDVMFKVGRKIVGRKIVAKPTVNYPERVTYIIDENEAMHTFKGKDAISVAHWNSQDKRVDGLRENACMTTTLLKGSHISFDHKDYTPCDTEVMLHSQVIMDEAARGSIAGIPGGLSELILNTYVTLKSHMENGRAVLEMTKIFKPPVERQYVVGTNRYGKVRQYTETPSSSQDEKKYFTKIDLETGIVLEETGEAEGSTVPA